MTQSTQAISPLRQRMIDDMTQCRLNPKTQEAYIRSVIKLTRFLGVVSKSRLQSPGTFSSLSLRGESILPVM